MDNDDIGGFAKEVENDCGRASTCNGDFHSTSEAGAAGVLSGVGEESEDERENGRVTIVGLMASVVSRRAASRSSVTRWSLFVTKISSLRLLTFTCTSVCLWMHHWGERCSSRKNSEMTFKSSSL